MLIRFTYIFFAWFCFIEKRSQFHLCWYFQIDLSRFLRYKSVLTWKRKLHIVWKCVEHCRALDMSYSVLVICDWVLTCAWVLCDRCIIGIERLISFELSDFPKVGLIKKNYCIYHYFCLVAILYKAIYLFYV